MKKIALIFGFLQILVLARLAGQTAADDYWLNNGFVSGQTVTTNSGTFYDDGGDGLYHAGQDWNVTFCSENGNPITLDFTGFATDYRGPLPPLSNEYLNYDYLLIQYPGASYVAYDDDTPQFGFTSASGCINFRFVSNAASILESGWSAEISADPAPANNDPCTAALLNVGNACSPEYFSNKGAYSTTNLSDPPCHSFFGGDVWFTLIVPSSGQVKIETFPGTLTYAILDIYRSSDCNILNSERISCVDGAGGMPSVTLTGRTPGERLYIRLFGDQAKSGQFGICVTDPTAPVTGYTGPGGVGDAASIDFWFRSDKGVLDQLGVPAGNGTAVMTWEDQSGNGNNLVQSTATLQPLMMQSVVNGFAALKFDGSDDMFSRELGSKGAPVQWFSVATFEGSARQSMLSLGNADVTHTASISRHTDGRYFCLSGADRYGPALNASQYYLFNARHKTTAALHNLRLNGSVQTVTDYATALNTDGSLLVGTSYLNTDYYAGYLPELIQYSRTLNTAQERIVENYLAAKYNLTLGSNDLYAWKASHKYDVAGIGRIDASNIHTKAASAGMLTIGGASDLENGEFAFIGHDNGNVTTWTTSGVPAGDSHIMRLERTWKVVVSGGDGIGTVSLGLISASLPALPGGFLAYNLLVDADGDFTSGAESYGLIQSGAEFVANGVDLSHGDYIAVAAVEPVISFALSSSSGLESVLHPQISVILNYACSDVVLVDYSVIGGTATPGTDFSLVDGSLTFNPGEKSKTIVPLIINDTQPEIPDEYFEVGISTSTPGITVGSPSTHTYTILNDDLSADVSASRQLTGACTTSSATLVGTYEGTGPFSFSWAPATGLSTTTNDTVTANPLVTTQYTFTVTDGFGQTASDTVTIFVQPLPLKPVITADGPTSFCEGGSVTLGTTTAYDQVLWSDNSVASTLEVFASGDFTVSGIDSFGCTGPLSDPLSITVNPIPEKPVLTMTGTTEFCSYDSLILVAPSGYAVYRWNGTVGDDTLIVKTGGNYSVTVESASGCESPTSDTVEVIVHTAPGQPVITAGGSTTFCEGGSVVLSLTETYDSYLWSNTETSPSIEVSETGNYTVQVADAFGCQAPLSDAVSVTVNPLPARPVLSLSGTTEFCSYDSLILIAPSGYVSYFWDGIPGDDSLIVRTSGTYSVTVAGADACESLPSDAVTVTVHEAPAKPVITPEGGAQICDGESLQLGVTEIYDTYLWDDGSTGSTRTVSAGGSYTVTGYDQFACASPVSDPVVISVNPVPAKPVLSLTGTTEFCSYDSLIIKAPEGYDSYLWNGIPGDDTLIVKNSGTFSLVVGWSTGCVSVPSDEVQVTVHTAPEKPVITWSGEGDICEGDSLYLEAPAAYSAYLWSDGYDQPARYIKTTGNYSVRVQDAFTCLSESSDIVNTVVHALPASPVITLDGPDTFCEGESTVLQASSGYAAWLWNNGQESQAITVIEEGDYSVSGIDAFGCVSAVSAAQTIIVHPKPIQPVISYTTPLVFFVGDSVVLHSSAGDSYLWSPGNETTSSVIVKVSGTYAVRTGDLNACLSDWSEPVIVEAKTHVDKPEITLSGATEFCDGGALTLTGPEGFSSYLWSNGESTREITVTTSGKYSLTVTNDLGFESEPSDTTEVVVYPLPVISLTSSNDPLCFGGNDGEINVSVSAGTEPYTYSWTGSDANGSDATGLEAGEYKVLVSDLHTCKDELTITLNEPDPLQVDTTIHAAFCPDFADGSIEVDVTGGTAPYSYLWSNGATTASLAGIPVGYYDLNITDQHGCLKEISCDIGFTNDICFNIPGIITPNNDRHNDTWKIDGLENYPGVTVEVFDRWGRRVFYSVDNATEFDGTYNGKELPMESYHYIIDLKNGSSRIIGNITIIR